MAASHAAPYVFISYASVDRDGVLPIAAALKGAGVAVWLDQQGIVGGANYGTEIADAIKGAAALVVIASSASLASRNVKQEIALAWEYERPYLPLLLEPVTIPDDLRYWLTAAQWVEVLDKPRDVWLPAVLIALSPLGIEPAVPAQADIQLAGREREVARLRERLAAAMGGKGSLVLIGGEAGIGKTTLADAIGLEAKRQGCIVLEGRCFDLAETPPYGPWIDLFRRLSASSPMPPLPAAFAERGTVGAVGSQMILVAQVEDFLAALATSRPVVVLFEDLHWADPASLDLLRAVARSLTTLPILLLATYRADELSPTHPLTRLLPALVREAEVERLDLRPLRTQDVATLVAERYHLADEDTTRLAAYVHQRSEGNPLFVGELLRTLEEEEVIQRTTAGWTLGFLANVRVPPLLRQIIEGRAARLEAESRRLLAIAAAVGQEVPLHLWASVASVPEETLLPVIEQATSARLGEATEDGTAMRFVHALIREALYEGMSPPVRRLVHRAVGEALAAGRAPDPDAVASHFQRANDERALPWLLRAGERAQEAYAWTTAAARFEAALALMERTGAGAGERGWILLRLANLLLFVDVAKARAFADEAVALAGEAGDGALAAYARFVRGSLACHAGDVAHGLPELEVGAAALAALSDAERAHFAAHAAAGTAPALSPEGRWSVMVLWRSHVGWYREARELGERLVAAVGHDETLQGSREGAHGLGTAYAMLGMPDAAGAMYTRAHDASIRVGNYVLAALTSRRGIELVALPYRAEEIAGRRWLAERAEAEWARVSGAVPGAFSPRFMHLPLLVLEGQWEEAERIAAAGSVDERGNIGTRTSALRYLAALARLRGDTARAWWAVRERLPAGAATEPGTVAFFDTAVIVQRVAAALALDDGDLPTAGEWLGAHDRWLAWSGAVLGQSEGQALWAAYYRQGGDTAHAREHAERALAHATEPRQSLALVAAHRLLGEFDTEARRYADAATHLDASLTLADSCAAPYERALTLLALARLHAARGDRAESLRLLAEVHAICLPLGAAPTLARVDSLVLRLDAPEQIAHTYPAGLSNREVEVLRLLAAGHSNAAIADRLSVSVRTVTTHLTTIYTKLGVSSRSAAMRFALDVGLT